MNHDLARHRWRRWGFVWDAEDEPETVTAEIVTEQAPVLHVHYHLHIPPGMTAADLSGLNLVLPPGSTVTTEERTEMGKHSKITYGDISAVRGLAIGNGASVTVDGDTFTDEDGNAGIAIDEDEED